MLRSYLESILNDDPAASPLGAHTDLVLLIRRIVRPRGYASGAFFACSLAGQIF